MIDHRICCTDSEITMRLLEDRMEILQMRDEGYSITAMVSYHSPTTLETHCLPVFHSDTLEDICNRYVDFFPKECQQAIQEAKHLAQTFYHQDGLSKSKTIMASLRVPLGLWKLLDAWRPGFWDVVLGQNRFANAALIKRLLSYMPKLSLHAA